MEPKTRNIIREIAVQTLQIEIEALELLKSSLDDQFDRLIDLIHRSKGRVVVSGIGKSALVAQKIVATLNSTGTPAMFMHAADAVHGDLGMIQPEDVVLLLSKSGFTEELRVLVPIVQMRGNTVAAIVGDKRSWLALHADIVLHTPISREADPNNLAPTASTTAQMALGDAIAMALLALRGFTPAQFAQLHPGGLLGKQLFLRVEHIYPHNERPAVTPDSPLPQVILEMTSRRLGCTVVEDEQGHPLGIITDGDLRRMLEKFPPSQLDTLTAQHFMTPHPKTIKHDQPAVEALALMRQHAITQLVVLEGDRYVGIVHLHDLIREGLL